MATGADDETRDLGRTPDATRALPSRREPNAARASDATRPVGRASDQAVTREALPALGGPRRGAELGGHRLGAELGRGGMGVVYRAEHLATGAVRAVKVLLADERSPEAQRFRREGQAMAAVDGHPNVLRVHAAGEAQGALWLAMDLAAGGSLEQTVERRGPLPSDEVARLGAALARGLAHVHGHGVLHRDLKPANVLLDERGRPMLVDFGLARLGGSERLTESGAIVGTPRYMAPEQVLADRGLEVDERTDVYGLGAVLYQGLTGKAPVEGKDTGDVLRRVVKEPPVPPRRLAPSASPALEAVILRCLEKRPDRRYPTARALADDLEAVVAGRAPAALRRRRDPVTPLLAAASVVAAALLAHQLLRAPPAPPPLPPPVALPAPASAGEALALLDDLLAREEQETALAALEAALERAREDPLSAPRQQELAPRLFAALLGTPPDAEVDARWAARAPALADAARAARALDLISGLVSGDDRASRAALTALPGTAPVAVALQEAQVALRAAHDQFSSDRAAEVVAPLDRAVARAEEAAPGPVGAALRLRVQRAVAGADGPLIRAGRASPPPVLALLARARRLLPGSRAADALLLTAGLVSWRSTGGQLPHLPASLDGEGLARRYAPQQVVLESFRVIGAERDAAGIVAGLAAWERLRDASRRLGLLDPRGEFGPDVVVPVDLSPHTDLMLRAYENVATLLVWDAWLARGRPEFAARIARARERAEATRRARPDVGGEQVVRVHLLAGDVAAARQALAEVVNDDGLEDWILRCLEADLALLEGDVERARRGLAALLAHQTSDHIRAQVALWAAAAEAEAGQLGAAQALVALAEEELAPSPANLVVPWRTLPSTHLLLDRARSGWRVAATGRLHPD